MRTVRWLATNLILVAPVAAVSFTVVWAVGAVGLRDHGVDAISPPGFTLLLLFFSPMWPFYMASLVVASRRARSFRRSAMLLAPLLGFLLLVGNLFVNVPEIQAAYVFYLLYGLVVVPHPSRSPARGAH